MSSLNIDVVVLVVQRRLVKLNLDDFTVYEIEAAVKPYLEGYTLTGAVDSAIEELTRDDSAYISLSGMLQDAFKCNWK